MKPGCLYLLQKKAKAKTQIKAENAVIDALRSLFYLKKLKYLGGFLIYKGLEINTPKQKSRVLEELSKKIPSPEYVEVMYQNERVWMEIVKDENVYYNGFEVCKRSRYLNLKYWGDFFLGYL
ncbi:hypothetical protein M422DRAFT_42594 [Sphaerobolus stellatus SS14]|nr:hypothetical protein M422DRAFT_42594 [Sphaerobolus stellatus SS14]